MSQYLAPARDMDFVINALLDAPALWKQMPRYASVDSDMCRALIENAAKFSENELAPLNASGDRMGVRLDKGSVKTPDGFKEAYRNYSAAGWGGMIGDPDYGGQGLPHALNILVSEVFSASNMSFSLYTGLTVGAGISLEAHATEELKRQYLPKMYEGVWSGCMCLTEAHAGTDLGIMRSKAQPQADGSYAISGTKIFITSGDHDMTENIIYLVLAKLPDAPSGPKGISLFLTPKFLPDHQGGLGDRNGVYCESLEEKMGIHASATCVMRFDNAKSYLIGEANRGLAAMFTMMNHERLMVGLQGVACAENAYQKARAYALDRRQGRSAKGPQSPETEADLILVHPDVRRMMLTQKAYIEGARAFSAYVGLQMDIAEYGEGQMRANAEKLVGLLTPVTKAFFTDKGFDCCVMAQQVFGGHGYIHESGVEQIVRDIRIAQIYEGTNGVQALDLVYRKIILNNGEWMDLFAGEIDAFVHEHQSNKAMQAYLDPLKDALAQMREMTRWVIDSALQNPDEAGAASVDYLHLVGYTALAWVWAWQASVALKNMEQDPAFYQAKLHVAKFYMLRLLPQTETLTRAIKSSSGVLMDMPIESF